jgi:hypothetical protein
MKKTKLEIYVCVLTFKMLALVSRITSLFHQNKKAKNYHKGLIWLFKRPYGNPGMRTKSKAESWKEGKRGGG